MTNADIAKVLNEMGELLELQGDNPFRVRAYYQAAKAIEYHGSSVEEIAKEQGKDALMEIPGIGDAIADKIIELVKTGHLRAYERLTAKVPRVELDLGTVPGVGPKTARRLYELFKPKSIEDLHNKLISFKPGKDSKGGIGGLGVKTIANIIRGIEILSAQGERMPLGDALPIADTFIERLKTLRGIKKIDVVGSLRRRQETIGDIDIIAATNEPERVIDTFVTTAGVSQILSRGETKAMVMYGKNIHVDLEILPEREYGSLLQHFTGSKEHNIAFRKLVESYGLSFSEHGFKVTNPRNAHAHKAITLAKKEKRWDERTKMILCADEKDVYKTVDLDYIAPELRENTGEVEAVLKGSLPKFVELKDICGDIHVHSNQSNDGRERPEDLIEHAIKLGYKYLGITDHTKGLGVAGKLTDKQLAKYAQDLRKLNKKYPEIKILPGCELNIMANGSLDVDEKVLAELDVVIASIHSAFHQPKEQITDRIMRALDNPNVDILAHPTTRILGYRDGVDADWQKIFKAAAESCTALEINASPQRLDLDGLHIKAAKEVGCKFVISTDTHQFQHLDNMQFGVAMARRGWCEKDDILNTLDIKKFEAWLKRS